MTFEELLKAQGLTEEQVKALTAGMKEHKLYLTGEENLDIRYSKLQEQHEGAGKELAEAKALIESLKKGDGDREKLREQIGEYESRVSALSAENEKLKAEAALKLSLLRAGAKAEDMDYLLYKASQQGEVKLNEDGTLHKETDLLQALKTQCPGQFAGAGSKETQENRLETGESRTDGTAPKTLAEALQQHYERAERKE